ncbi:MAG: ArsR/SmtB family transcription factor [Candidatus Hodarchaeales archaeon]|jgi:ArsR family transcriptional regulator
MVSNSVKIQSKKRDTGLKLQAELCQSLTHPLRLKIINILKDGKKNVNMLQEITNERQPVISQHLKVLRDKGVVSTERNKHEIFYSLTDPKILEICNLVAGLVEKRQESSK